MLKAGLFGAVIGLLYVMGLALFFPVCVLCFTPLLGLGVGYMAANIDEPVNSEASVGRATLAGIIASVGALVGQILAALVNGILITNSENFPDAIIALGVPASLTIGPNQYWQGILVLGSLCSVLNMTVIIGLAALGGQLWFRRQRRLGDILS